MGIQLVEQVDQVVRLVFVRLVKVGRLRQDAADSLTDFICKASTLGRCGAVPLGEGVFVVGSLSFFNSKCCLLALERRMFVSCIDSGNFRLWSLVLARLHGTGVHPWHLSWCPTIADIQIVLANILAQLILKVQR